MSTGDTSNNRQNLHNLQVFLPGNEPAYQKWRESKLASYASGRAADIVEVADLSQPKEGEICDILTQCSQSNLAIYQLKISAVKAPYDDSKLGQLRQNLTEFCLKLGLHDAELHRSRGEDGVVAIEVNDSGVGAGYIPYSNKPLSWHTDGYYNAPEGQIRAMVLHCVRDASKGGVNELLDYEIAYIRLRDADPVLINALMHKEAMIIPENTDKRTAYRAPSVGPVFFVDEKTGALNMRYSARGRNIIWRDDPDTQKARAMLIDIMQNDPLVIRHKFKPGQGIISNNVLHNRTRFENSEGIGDDKTSQSKRLLYRVRYANRVGEGLDIDDI